jgi:hypothetical protein
MCAPSTPIARLRAVVGGTTFLQPFLTYTTPTQWTFALNTESTLDWENEQWSMPVNANVSPDSGAENFGLRFTVTLLFPR